MAKILPSLSLCQLYVSVPDTSNVPIHGCNCKATGRVQKGMGQIDEGSGEWPACHHLSKGVHDTGNNASGHDIADGSPE